MTTTTECAKLLATPIHPLVSSKNNRHPPHTEGFDLIFVRNRG